MVAASRKRSAGVLGAVLLLAGQLTAAANAAAAAAQLPLQLLSLPAGFSAEVFLSEPIENARMMALGQSSASNWIVYVSSTGDKVTAVIRRPAGTKACTLLSGLDNPNGIAYRSSSLFVATVTAITRYDNVDKAALDSCNASLLRSKKLITLEDNGGHTSRALAIGPDSKLYFGIGSVDNAGICVPPTCTIQRMDLDGSSHETFASNMRNPASIAFQPSTGRLFFTNMGRDLLGDNMPDDTLMSPSRAGLDYVFPFCHWVGTGNPELRSPGPGSPLADDTTPPPGKPALEGLQAMNKSYGSWCAAHAPAPVQALGPHVAPIGMAFYELEEGMSGAFPQEWQGGVFVAEHGSWNRQKRIGYRVAHLSLQLDGSKVSVTRHRIFASGWLQQNQSVWGRPVGALVAPDGSLLISDDYANTIYRIKYSATAPPPPALKPCASVFFSLPRIRAYGKTYVLAYSTDLQARAAAAAAHCARRLPGSKVGYMQSFALPQRFASQANIFKTYDPAMNKTCEGLQCAAFSTIECIPTGAAPAPYDDKTRVRGCNSVGHDIIGHRSRGSFIVGSNSRGTNIVGDQNMGQNIVGLGNNKDNCLCNFGKEWSLSG